MAQVRDFLAAGPTGTVLHPVPTNSVPGADPTRTQVLSATTAAPTTAAPATAAPAPVAPAPPVPARRRPARALPVLVGLAVLLVGGLVAWAALSGGDGGSQTQSPPGGSSSSSRTPSPSTSPSPSESPSSSTGATPAGMESFIQDYLATVTSDQKASWEMLTPKFQEESGGFGKYKGFWKTIESARPTSIQADPDTLQVHYGVDYVRTDRSRVSDTVTLQLVYDAANDSYLIDGEA